MRAVGGIGIAALVVAAIAGLASAAGSATATNAIANASTSENENAAIEAALTGRQIYERALENRFETYTQEARLISGDRAGNTQETRFELWFESQRGPDRKPREGNLLSKALVKYTHPFDLRHTGYLVINRLDAANDQFLYLASTRRVKRVNLRGEAVFGTDFSLEDVLPREVEDASYERRPDEEVDGVPVFVVDAMPLPRVDSEYSRFRVHVEKERYVPLRALYWDQSEREIKRLEVERSAIEQIEQVWVPMKMRMQNLSLESFTELRIDEIVPNPKLSPTTFEMRRLEGR